MEFGLVGLVELRVKVGFVRFRVLEFRLDWYKMV